MREEKIRWDTTERIFRRVKKRRNEDARPAATDRMLETQLDKTVRARPRRRLCPPYRVASRQGPDRVAIILLGKRK